MMTAAILKIEKLWYICNRLTDFDKFWHSDASWLPRPNRLLKFKHSKIQHNDIPCTKLQNDFAVLDIW